MILKNIPNKEGIYYSIDAEFCCIVALPALHVKPLYHLEKFFTFSGYVQNEISGQKKDKRIYLSIYLFRSGIYFCFHHKQWLAIRMTSLL